MSAKIPNVNVLTSGTLLNTKIGTPLLVLCPCRQLNSDDPQGEHGIPEDIVRAWKAAVQSKSKHTKTALFAAFLKSGKNWGRLLS